MARWLLFSYLGAECSSLIITRKIMMMSKLLICPYPCTNSFIVSTVDVSISQASIRKTLQRLSSLIKFFSIFQINYLLCRFSAAPIFAQTNVDL